MIEIHKISRCTQNNKMRLRSLMHGAKQTLKKLAQWAIHSSNANIGNPASLADSSVTSKRKPWSKEPKHRCNNKSFRTYRHTKISELWSLKNTEFVHKITAENEASVSFQFSNKHALVKDKNCTNWILVMSVVTHCCVMPCYQTQGPQIWGVSIINEPL